jgi:hypothetical protein
VGEDRGRRHAGDAAVVLFSVLVRNYLVRSLLAGGVKD